MADVEHLSPPFRARVQRLLADPEAVRLGLYVVSGFRPLELQRQLYDAKLADVRAAHPSWTPAQIATEAGRWVAPPGRSNHGPRVDDLLHEPGPYGRAVDLGLPGVAAAHGKWPTATKRAVDVLARRYGLQSPMSWEDWHYEPLAGFDEGKFGMPAPGPSEAHPLAVGIVGDAALLEPAPGAGYTVAAADGGVFAFGAALYRGSVPELIVNHILGRLNAPVVGIAGTPTGHGYWLTAADGGVFAFGDAAFLGSAGGSHLNAPVLGIAATPDGTGYWLVAADGGVFTYGSAGFYGSTGDRRLNSPIVGMAAHPSRAGYWLVAADGGVFSFGDVGFFGSMGGKPLNRPVCALVPTRSGMGYWLVAGDGGVFAFGDAGGVLDPLPGVRLNQPIVAAARVGAGLVLVAGDGGVFVVGDAPFLGRPLAA
jgi:hypothetical protein